MQGQPPQQSKQTNNNNCATTNTNQNKHGGRNNKKKHHHGAANHNEHTRDQHRGADRHNNNPGQASAAATNSNQQIYIICCKICNQELSDLEKEFYPCNCKYKICQKCFKHHVEHENGKCPNCGLLYEVNRVNEYYANKMKQQQVQTAAVKQTGASSNKASMAAASGKKTTRNESPQPNMTQAAAASTLAQSNSCMLPPNGAKNNLGPGAPMGGKNQNTRNNNKQQVTAQSSRAQQKQNNHARQRGGNNAGQQQQTNKNGPTSQKVSTQQESSAITSGNNKNSTIYAAQASEPQGGSPTNDNAVDQSQSTQTSKSTKNNKSNGAPASGVKQSTQLALTENQSSRPAKKGAQNQRNSSEQQRNQQKLSSVRILQRNTLYVIGLSPNVAKEETLRRYEYFSQYGRILTVTINKEKAFKSENQGLCFSAYINYAGEREASLAILAVDQFVFDGRLLRASYGRTKYCRFFLKGTNCLNHECPYLHKEAHPENILTQEDMNKKILFQQCQQLALKLSKLTEQTEEQCRASLRAHKESIIRAMKPHTSRIIMPQLESIFEKKSLFKHCINSETGAAAMNTSDISQPSIATPSVQATPVIDTSQSQTSTILTAPPQSQTQQQTSSLPIKSVLPVSATPATLSTPSLQPQSQQQTPTTTTIQQPQQKIIIPPTIIQPQQQPQQIQPSSQTQQFVGSQQKDFQQQLTQCAPIGSHQPSTQQKQIQINPVGQQQPQMQQALLPLDLSLQQKATTGGNNRSGAAATFLRHRGSHGCASELQSSSNVASVRGGMGSMMFGAQRNRLQSSGTLGELDFNNKNSTCGVINRGGHQHHQLLPQGFINQSNRRFAQDDHYLTRVPPADFRLQAAVVNPAVVNNAAPAGPMFKAAALAATKNSSFTNSIPFAPNTTNTNNLQQQHNNGASNMVTFNLMRPRFGSPHPPQNNRLYFQQQQFPLPPQNHNQTSLHATRDSDKMTQQSSSQYQTNFHHVSQVQYHQPQRQTLHFQSQFMVSQDWGVQDSTNSLYHHPDNRARSGSQAAMVLEQYQFEEAKMPERRRKSSHGKFRIFQEPCKESPSPTNKSEQRRFASKLRQALQQFIKGGDPATDRDSTEQFSSIFAGGDEGRRPIATLKNRNIQLNYNNCSEGVAGGQACSPIRDSILQSRRNSEDYGTLTRPRSQHSLIVESVARILDDTVIEQHRGDREKQRLQMTNEPNFKTGPPSEVHQLMYDVDQQPEGAMLNSHFYFDFESKLNNQFNDMASSNSMTTNPANLQQHQQQQQTTAANAPNQHQIQRQITQKSQDFPQQKQPAQAHTSFQQLHHQTPIQQQPSQQRQCQNLTFTSPNQNHTVNSQGGHLGANNNVWHQSNSLYNSPFFLIPTQTQNAQHRSAAYHDHTLRHLYSQSNPFSLSGMTTGQGAGGYSARGGTNVGMANDTLRLTYNPHPLLPPTTSGGGRGAGHSSNLSSQTGGLFRNTTTQSDQDHSFPLLSRTTSQPFIMRSEQKVIQRGSNNQLGQQQSSIGGTVNNNLTTMTVQQRKMNNSQLEFSRSHQIQYQQQQQNHVAVQRRQHQQQPQQNKHGHQQQQQAAQLTQRNLELLNKKYCPSKDMLYAKIFTDFVPQSSSSPRSNKRVNTTNNQVSSFGGLHAPMHPVSVQNYTITPQSLFCFALDGDDSNNDLLGQQSSTAKLRIKGIPRLQKQVSRDDAALGILSTPTGRKEPSLFFNSSSNNLDKVKETSMTPTNKHSRAIATNWNDYVAAAHNVNEDTRSLKQLDQNRGGSGLMHYTGSGGGLPRYKDDPISADELEMANQLANEASLGCNDLMSTRMHHLKSKKSQYDAYVGTRMSVVDGECQPQRSRSQSFRDRNPTEDGQAIMSATAHHQAQILQQQQMMQMHHKDETERKLRRDKASGSQNHRMYNEDSSERSNDSYSSAHKRNIGIKVSQGGPSVATATTTGCAPVQQKTNYFQEFVKVREGFRKSSGLISSSGFGAAKVETRRSSYSQGRNCSNRTAIQLMDVTRRGSFKQGQLRRSQIISPLGLLKFKNHQIDEVAEDGVTERDSKKEFKQDPTSVRMNSVDSQSYNLKTLKSVSRSRKESHSQNGNNNFD